jgi:hypothetical protein
MVSSPGELPVENVEAELKRLRQGEGLAHPSNVLKLSPQLRLLLAGADSGSDAAGEVVRIITALRQAIDHLAPHERLYAQVDFNLSAEHSYQTLTDRQESLARRFACAGKTVRRRADRALQTVALLLVTGEMTDPVAGTADRAFQDVAATGWRHELRRFWRLTPHRGVDIICSEIPENERPYFASPDDRNYLRYAKFADLDSLIFVKTHLAQTASDVTVRDFSPSEYYDTDAQRLVVIGGPPWNAKYREFLPQLPYHFEPHPLGEDDPLVIPQLGVVIGPRWTPRGQLLQDVAVFTRLTLAQGTTVFLLAGCLTLGVLGAAKCFLQGRHGARNAEYIDTLVGERDFVLVTEARRVGGITDTADLTARDPLVLLARQDGDDFSVIADNTKRYATG